MLTIYDTLQYVPLFYGGLAVTIKLWLGALALATILGLIWTSLIWLRVPILGRLSEAFIVLIRGVPILVQLFYIYFLFPSIGVALNAYWASVVALGFAFSAYMAEVFRAGVLAIDKGQAEAAESLAMKPLLIVRRVIIPQAARTSLPGYSNIVVMILKTTSIASVIAVPEISRTALLLVQTTYKNVELFTLLAVLYILISIPLIAIIRRMEAR